MLNKIVNIINKFDPLDLLPYAPPDEYEKEIVEINSFLEKATDCDVNTLADKIYSIFRRTLGDEIFDRSYNDCCEVANEILQEISNTKKL